MKQVKKNPETPTNQHLPEFNSTSSKRISHYINNIGNVTKIFATLTPTGRKDFISVLNKLRPPQQESLTRNVAQIFATLIPTDKHRFISTLNKLEPPEQESLTRNVAELFAELTLEDQHNFISALSKLEPPEQERLTRDVAEMLSIIKQADINNGEEKEKFPDTPLHQLFRDESIEEINQKYPRFLEYAGYKNLQGQLPSDILKSKFGEIPSKLRACNEDIN